ncbi:MAG: triose-phosphate isomerase [Balneolaceae bacterium]
MSRFLIAGNWKMNAGPNEAKELATKMTYQWKGKSFSSEALICPPSISLQAVSNAFEGSTFKVGAQNVSTEDNGAFTGEISTTMLKDLNLTHVIVGHSERREYYHEDDNLVAKKADKVISDGLTAIVCVGEKLDKRKSGDQEAVVTTQLDQVLKAIDKKDASKLVVAYEPVWAIGTGETASPEQAQEMHAFIRNLIAERWDESSSKEVKILYGGSMKPANAKELLSQKDVDGGLIGGASLQADSFSEIISIAEELHS